MNLSIPKILFFATPLLVGFCPPVAAQEWGWDKGKIADAILKAQETHANFQNIHKIMFDIEDGKKPDTSMYGSDWRTLSQGYRDAVADVDAIQIPAFFPRGYEIAPAVLNDCRMKQQNIQLLRDLNMKVAERVKAAETVASSLDNEVDKADQTVSTINYLIQVTRDASRAPIIGQLFVWDWYALETSVRSEAALYRGAVKRKAEKFEDEIAKAKLHQYNLAQNIKTIETSMCILSGSYRPIRLFQASGNNTFVLNGSSQGLMQWMFEGQRKSRVIDNIIVNGSTISWQMGGRSFKGTISNDYSTITLPEGVYQR